MSYNYVCCYCFNVVAILQLLLSAAATGHNGGGWLLCTAFTTTSTTTCSFAWQMYHHQYPHHKNPHIYNDYYSSRRNELYMSSTSSSLLSSIGDDGDNETVAVDDTASNIVRDVMNENFVDDSFPSTDTASDTTPTSSSSTSTTTISTTTKEEKLSFLTSLGAITGRGEFMLQTRYRPSTQQQYKAVETVVSELEAMNSIRMLEPTKSSHIYGTWELVYSNTQLFRHSPFFLAGRAVCDSKDDVQKYNWFCDMHRAALSISQIQNVRQIIIPNDNDTDNNNNNNNQLLVSEFEVNVGSIPFLANLIPQLSYSGGLPISITGAIVSTADITPTIDGTGWEIYMDTVQIKGSNIPLIRTILDNDMVALQSRAVANVLEQTLSSYTTPPKPIFRTTYLDEQYRISRDVDDHIFVYVKTSNSTIPTDYGWVDADLGIGRLLEGLNDAVTKLYI